MFLQTHKLGSRFVTQAHACPHHTVPSSVPGWDRCSQVEDKRSDSNFVPIIQDLGLDQARATCINFPAMPLNRRVSRTMERRASVIRTNTCNVCTRYKGLWSRSGYLLHAHLSNTVTSVSNRQINTWHKTPIKPPLSGELNLLISPVNMSATL